MASGGSKKQRRLRQEAEELRAKRRQALIRCVLAFAGLIVFIGVKQALALWGIIASTDMIANMLTYLVAIVMCAVAGMATLAYTRAGKRLKEIEQELR